MQAAGPVSFVCLDAPSDSVAETALPLSDCSGIRTVSTDDYSVPHLYALVTQPLRGEVVVIDLTTDVNAVIDQNPSTPGSNFLPVGAQPTDIASTPGSSASFVTVGAPGFEGIFALPSTMLRGGSPQLSSWPSCALPAAPGEIVIALDPADADGQTRPACNLDYGAADPDSTCGPDATTHCHGDLSVDAIAAGHPGRYKLIVSLPSEGGFAVIDAQDLLDTEAGAFDACEIERWVPLQVKLPAPPPPPTPSGSDACADADPVDLSAESYSALPGGFTADDGLLYIADRNAPVIHRIDLNDPCAPVELPPLLPTSTEDPGRVVTTSRVVLSPLTLDLKRFLYAIDIVDDSIMMFDVSDDSLTRAPLERPHAARNPYQPTDRVRFISPPRDIIIAQHQHDEVDNQTGASLPVRCDPTDDKPGSGYQTSPAFDSGAGPTKLRGLFAFAVLASGDIVVIDVDDYDAPCRGPKDQHGLFGCEAPIQSDLSSSGEFTCQVSAPHQLRAGGYLVQQEGVASNQPGVQGLPLLFGDDGSLLELDPDPNINNGVPRMRATVPANVGSEFVFTLTSGSTLETLDSTTGLLNTAGTTDGSAHTLAFNLEDPRAHILDQSWTVIYEGALPGFGGRFAELKDLGNGQLQLLDVGSRFCSHGVMSQNAVAAQLVEDGLEPEKASKQAAEQADYVQLTSDTPVDIDAYWDQQQQCTFNACLQTYGSSETPREARDLRIVEGTEDRLDLVRRLTPESGAPSLKCCFPSLVEFRVRGGHQWIVTGSSVGLLHHVVANDAGVCRPTCDPNEALLNGRVLETASDAGPVGDGDPLAFHNPFFRFAINAGASDVGAGSTSVRDMRFELDTQGAFDPLTMTMITSDSNVQPTSVTYLDATGELVVSDGSLQGLTFIKLSSLAITRQYQ